MIIKNIQTTRSNTCNELSGSCGDFKLWYRFPTSIDPEPSADAFVAAALIPAMHRGTDIQVSGDYTISSDLVDSLQKIQDIFLIWNEYYKKNFGKTFSQIRINGNRTDASSPVSGVASYFSGGVDGLDTFLRNRKNIDFLVFARGIDMQLDSIVYDEAFARNQEFLKQYDKPLISIDTNVRFLCHHYGLGWQSFCAGSGLASIALAGGFERCFIASTNSYAEVRPDGSNCITDPMWSNGATNLIYDGGTLSRNDKIRHIADTAPEALDLLRVCWQDQGYNCGECGKCLRTMLSLRLMGLTSASLPAIDDEGLRKIRASRLYRDDDLMFYRENLALARTRDDKKVIRALLGPMRNYMAKRIIRDCMSLARGRFT